MKTPLTLLLFLLPFLGFAQNSGEATKTVYFNYASYELTAVARAALDDLAAMPGMIVKVELSGHTDSDGDAQENEILSQNRVTAVRDYLVSKGVDPQKIRVALSR